MLGIIYIIIFGNLLLVNTTKAAEEYYKVQRWNNDYSCGVYSTYFASAYAGKNYNLTDVSNKLGIVKESTNIKNITSTLKKLNVNFEILKVKDLRSIGASILILESSFIKNRNSKIKHFAFAICKSNGVKFFDPLLNFKPQLISYELISKHFTGYAIKINK